MSRFAKRVGATVGRVLRSRALKVLAALAVALVLWALVRRYALRPAPPPPDEATLEHVRRVRIVRDTWGVPHIFGERDADAAFGLAYAHAEDDFPTIQLILAAGRGQLSLLLLSKLAIGNDYYTELVAARQEVDATYEQLPEDVRAVLEGYARGLNYYAYLHTSDVDTRLLPFRGRDIAAGFAHQLPLMLGLPKIIEALRSDHPPALGEEVLSPHPTSGSNAHAVAASRSTDATTRLNVNSHQPWEGPGSWYEAHVTSEEGWNMSGGTFPGAPFILHGHNDKLGWAHTVNAPDLVDVYALVTDKQHPEQYFFDGAWRDLEKREARLEIDTGLFNLVVHKTAYASVHGPVLVTDHGAYAIRYAGIGRRVFAAEQWFRMNKATSFEQWRDGMRVNGIPMFNTVFADASHIFYVYNAELPVRPEGVDYTRVLPGDRADLVFDRYLPFDELPQVLDPPSGFVQTCNATPFAATSGEGNPSAEKFSSTAGIETHQTNRALRTLALLGTDEKISRDAFLRMKWDRAYDPDSKIYTLVVNPLVERFQPQNDNERRAISLLQEWNGVAEESSCGASLAILTYKTLDPDMRASTDPVFVDPVAAFRNSIEFLASEFGRVDVALGDVQRLHRGKVDLPLGGGPDVLNATYTKRESGRLIGTQGDSLVMLVEFGPDGVVHSESVQPFGASSRPSSKHYNDQSALFVTHRFKPTFRDPEQLAQHTERSYRPGEELKEPRSR